MPPINPEMIVLARESRGLTQAELAERLNIHKGRLSKIENGFLEFPEDLLNPLTAQLEYPKDFFFSEVRVYPANLPFYRKHKTLQSRTQSKIVAQMNVFRKHVNDLMRDLDSSFATIPEFDVDEFGRPEEIAKAVRQVLGLPKGPIGNLTKILEDVGIVVVLLDAPTHKFSGASMVLETANYILFANANMPADRLRFTLAHELGHIVMHRYPTPDLESEADSFAREFLLPSDEVKHLLSDLNLSKLAALKRYWRVSMGAILVHAHRLGMIMPRQYQYLWTQMGKAGYRMKEPQELDFPRDEPCLLNEMIEVHRKEMGYSDEEISRKIGLFIDEFKTKFRIETARHGLRLVKA